MKILSQGSELLKGIPKEILDLAPTTPLIDIKDISTAKSPATSIFVASELEPLQIVEHILDQSISSVLQMNKKYFLEDLKMLARLKQDSEGYFKNYAGHLFPDTAEKIILEFGHANEKEQLRAKILEFAQKTKSQSVVESTQAIFEELYMNAILDAPKEALKRNQKMNHYDQGVKATFCLVRSDLQLAISCSDPYGSLDCQKFLKRLREIYQKGAGQVINLKKEGGAGIGCSLMWENSASIILGVIPNKKTVVTCVIPLGLSNRQRAEVKKSLHLVEL